MALNENVYDIITALCMGVAAGCFSMYIFKQLARIQVEKGDEQTLKQLPVFIRLCMPVAGNFRKFVMRPDFDNYRKTVQERIIMSGYEDVLTAEQFLSVYCVMGLIALISGVSLIAAGSGIFGIFIIGLLFYYPHAWLKSAYIKRHIQIQKALPNVIDLLTLSVEAGKDFLTSLRDILARRKRDPLGEELERTFREIQLGKKRADALRDLIKRVKQPDLTSVINAIIQADELGVSIANILRIQGDQLRVKRFNRAEKMANETPVKIILPIALFIVPAVFIIIGAPFILQIISVVLNK
jgi:tight adherence protein C